jgi:hypothetical protein
MKDRLIFLGITILGVLPGLIVLFIALISKNGKEQDNVIGGNTLPTAIWFNGLENLKITPTWFSLTALTVSMIVYVACMIWMTRELR